MGLMSRIVAWSIGGSIAYASYYTGVWTLNSRESKTNYNQLRDMLRPEIEYNQMKATPHHEVSSFNTKDMVMVGYLQVSDNTEPVV